MDWRQFLIDPADLAIPGGFEHGDIVIVDCDSQAEICGETLLPRCPVIGLGSRDGPLAGWCDAVIEAPVSIESVVQQITAKPHAAAVLVQLLRLLPGLPVLDGLAAESMAYGLLQAGEEHGRWLAGRGDGDGAGCAEGGILLERDGGLLTITFDGRRPDNGIDRAVRDALHEALMLGVVDPEITRIVLAGRGRCFSMGADLAEFGTTRDPVLAHAIRWQTLPARPAALCADRMEAHVDGGCVGAGLELAAWSRTVLASERAWFQLPELAMGVLPGAGGCVSLTRRIGRQRAALMILSGKRLSARQALGWGLVDAVVDHFPA